jgi:hypothetical protein
MPTSRYPNTEIMNTKSPLLLAVSILSLALTAALPILAADENQSFRGAAQSADGSVLTVSGGGETHKFQVSRSTKVLDSEGKATDLAHALNQSVEVTYSGKKEPYSAITVQCLEQ